MLTSGSVNSQSKNQFDAIVVERLLKYAEMRTKAYKRNREALSSSGFLLKRSERRVENKYENMILQRAM